MASRIAPPVEPSPPPTASARTFRWSSMGRTAARRAPPTSTWRTTGACSGSARPACASPRFTGLTSTPARIRGGWHTSSVRRRPAARPGRTLPVVGQLGQGGLALARHQAPRRHQRITAQLGERIDLLEGAARIVEVHPTGTLCGIVDRIAECGEIREAARQIVLRGSGDKRRGRPVKTILHGTSPKTLGRRPCLTPD